MINTAFQNGEEQILLSQLNKDSEADAAAADRSRNQVMDALCACFFFFSKKHCACISTEDPGTGAHHQSQ